MARPDPFLVGILIPQRAFSYSTLLSLACFLLSCFPCGFRTSGKSISLFLLSTTFHILTNLSPGVAKNIFVRKYLERRKARKVAEAKLAAEEAENERDYGEQSEEEFPSQLQTGEKQEGPTGDYNGQNRRNFFSRKKASGHRRVESTGADSTITRSDLPSIVEERPAFSSQMHGQPVRKVQPRAVAIPYSRLMKSRFYDWPPDPTVSRATPIMSAAALASSQTVEPIPEIPSIIIPARTNKSAAGRRRRSGG
jgi:hypothetical protein